ncbi:MAG TPA: LLM class flavin-dependent oxidoreductase [Acidimicrobiales bacterium]|nr:LLM class flavin-dependent oxidoreductase [Acidimicrobiales bacterium]
MVTVLDSMENLEFGFQLTPTTEMANHRRLVAAAEAGGLDVVGVQDHPYVPNLVDAFSLIGDLLARTERLRFFPDVANLPLRPPAMLAKAAGTLDLVSGGRFELAVGAGGYWDAITKMGVPRLSTSDAAEALEEAIRIIRALWRPGEVVRLSGKHHSVTGTRGGPAPAHPVGIWIGAQGPRAQRLTGRVADGWAAPIPSYLPYEKRVEANTTIDRAAEEAGRDPGDVLRMAQLVGTVTKLPGRLQVSEGAEPVRGTASQWAELIANLATEQPFRTFVFWPEEHTVDQVERFAREVVPAARELLTAAA